jgi:tetratricopeptide (TPR) repeat protein
MAGSGTCARPAERPARRALAALALALLTGCDPVARGDEAWAEGDAAGAAEAWTSAGEALDAAHRQRLARALYQEGSAAEAAAALEGVAPEDLGPDGHLVAGLLLADAGRPDLAVAAFESGVAAGGSPELSVNLCTTRLAIDARPLSSCQAAIEAAPLDPRAFIGLARAAVREGLGEAAREALTTATGLAGEAPEATLAGWLAEAWAELGGFEQACSWGARGGASPLDTGRWCAAGGRTGQARGLLEPLVEAGGEQAAPAAEVLLSLAVAEAEAAPGGAERELAMARARRWARALEGGGGEPDAAALTDLGRLERLDGRLSEAERLWGRAVALAPAEPAPRLNLAAELERRGRLDEARELLTPPDGMAPLHTQALALERARLEQRAGESTRSREIAEAVQGTCLEVSAGGCVAAASWLLAGLLAGDEPEAALDHLALALEGGGDVYRARVARAVELDPLRDRLRFHEIVGYEPR